MFSGIVEYQAKVLAVEKTSFGKKIELEFDEERLKNLVEGASVAINGVCLTVTEIKRKIVSFDAIPETLAKTNLDELKLEDVVNIERALKFGDEIGGHLLSGHIFKVVSFLGYDEKKKYHLFANDKEISPYLHYKGFVALNGISLTLSDVNEKTFAVSIIPYTLKHTNLSKIQTRDKINVEVSQ